MYIGNIDISSLLKAFKKFELFRTTGKTEIEQAGIIQAFEYTFELSWKMMKKILEDQGIKTVTPKETLRLAARAGFIDAPEIWFSFLEKRNLTSHTYNEHEVEAVISVCDSFSDEVKKFLKNIGVSSNQY
jgi:nucleotidyltransferase substrate binding protein (TIGR01987 family)